MFCKSLQQITIKFFGKFNKILVKIIVLNFDIKADRIQLILSS